MSQEEKPPREFWILKDLHSNRAIIRFVGEIHAGDVNGEPSNHWTRVIRYDEYEQMRERVEHVEAQNQRLRVDSKLNSLNECRDKLHNAESRIAKLRSALEKIGDPTKRDHREPDKYTECGCMMNMADEALADDKASK